MRRITLTAGLLFCASLFAQQSQTKANPNPSPSAQAPEQSTAANPHGIPSNAGKAEAYDKWTDNQKMSVAKSMRHDWSKLTPTQRTDALAQMTEQDKAQAYDYYFTHNHGKNERTR